MNKTIKWTLLLSAILIISIFVNGCSSKDGEEDQDLDPTSNDQIIEENEDDPIEDIESIKLPAFNLEDLDGNMVSSDILEDYDITIVSIWQSTCGPCIEELGALDVIYDEYKDKGVNVLGISVDNIEMEGKEGVKEFVESLDLNFTNMIADEEYLMKLVEYVQGTPTAFIVGKEGEFLMEARVGTNGKEEDIKDFKAIIEEMIK